MAEIFIINTADSNKSKWGEENVLSPKGTAQAYVLNHMKTLNNVTKVQIAESKAAEQTAQIAFPTADTIVNHAFDEISYGEMDGVRENPYDRARFIFMPETFLEYHYGSNIEEKVSWFDKAVINFNDFLNLDNLTGAIVTGADIMRLWFAKRKNLAFTTGLDIKMDGCQMIYFNPDQYSLKVMPGFSAIAEEKGLIT